jgi:CheY-like chemotaxis protein
MLKVMLKAPYILLGEDSEADTYFARRCFAAAGIKATLRRCANGAELCDYLRHHKKQPPVAVILDLKMPFMDGFETLKWIRQSRTFKEIPVVILSSSGLDEDRARAEKLGCTEYLEKPTSLAKYEVLMKGLAHRLVTNAAIAEISASQLLKSPGGKTSHSR